VGAGSAAMEAAAMEAAVMVVEARAGQEAAVMVVGARAEQEAGWVGKVVGAEKAEERTKNILVPS